MVLLSLRQNSFKEDIAEVGRWQTEDRHVWVPAVFLNWLLMFSLMQTALLAIHLNATWFRPDSHWCTCTSLILHARPCWKPLKPWRQQKFSWCCRRLTHITLGLNICSMEMHPTQTSSPVLQHLSPLLVVLVSSRWLSTLLGWLMRLIV